MRKSFLLLPLVTITCLSCSILRHKPTPLDEPRLHANLADETIARADSLYTNRNFTASAAILKKLGQQGSSYYRMDDVLYRLGRADLGMGAPDKALRSFDLLRRNYSRAEYLFPDLVKWEEEARKSVETPVGTNRNTPAGTPVLLNNLVGQASLLADGPKISNVFFDTDVRQALADVSDQAGVSIIADPTVQGYVNAKLEKAPLESALEQILSPLGLIYRKMDGYYLVGTPKQDSPSFPAMTETRRVQLKNLKVGEALKLLPKYYADYLNGDEKSDALTISAPPHVLEKFLADLAAIDTPPQQFVIEAAVVEMGNDTRKMLGLDWDWSGTNANSNSFSVSKLLPANMDSSFLAEIFWPHEDKWGLDFDLRVALRALASSGKVNIRANPRVTTQHGQEAVIRIGKESYYSLVRGPVNYPYVSLEKISTGINLKIIPYRGDYGEINNKIYVEVSDVTGTGVDNLPVTSVRSVDTEVSVANGQTFGIGGLVMENVHDNRNRIPFLGDIPVLGYLFGSSDRRKETSEVVILITPHVLLNPRDFDDL